LKKNACFESKKHQIDEYFVPAHRNFINVRPAKEWLRLRNTDGVYSVNYKNWHINKVGKGHYCDEYETRIQDQDQMKKIFKALDLKPIVTVSKQRENWIYKDYKISIDSVSGLGDFVEVEYIGREKDVEPEKITEEMIEFLKGIGCGKIKRNYRGYPFLLLFPKEGDYEEP